MGSTGAARASFTHMIEVEGNSGAEYTASDVALCAENELLVWIPPNVLSRTASSSSALRQVWKPAPDRLAFVTWG